MGINSSGTMGHSYIQKFERGIDSFQTYYNIYDKKTILLIDTYDTEKAAKKISQFENIDKPHNDC